MHGWINDFIFDIYIIFAHYGFVGAMLGGLGWLALLCVSFLVA